jgi:hypothetical protein
VREMIRWNQAERVVPYEWQLYESLGDLLVSSQVLQVATPERSNKACIVNMNERPDFIDEGSLQRRQAHRRPKRSRIGNETNIEESSSAAKKRITKITACCDTSV